MVKTPQEGAKAPAFNLAMDNGESLSLKDLAGKRVVLYFYPKDDTSGCTKEALDFSAHLADFKKRKTVVLGVSKDSLAAHKKFKSKHDLTIDLGSDLEGQVIEAYGSWVEKSMYGRKYMGIDRSTFLIDGAGIVQKIWRKVKVPGHVQEVLAAIDAM